MDRHVLKVKSNSNASLRLVNYGMLLSTGPMSSCAAYHGCLSRYPATPHFEGSIVALNSLPLMSPTNFLSLPDER